MPKNSSFNLYLRSYEYAKYEHPKGYFNDMGNIFSFEFSKKKGKTASTKLMDKKKYISSGLFMVYYLWNIKAPAATVLNKWGVTYRRTDGPSGPSQDASLNIFKVGGGAHRNTKIIISLLDTPQSHLQQCLYYLIHW